MEQRGRVTIVTNSRCLEREQLPLNRRTIGHGFSHIIRYPKNPFFVDLHLNLALFFFFEQTDPDSVCKNTVV